MLPCAAPVASYDVRVPGRPFGVVETLSGRNAFVAISSETPSQLSGIAVLRCADGRFVFDHLVPLSPSPIGLALTPDGKTLLVADDSYLAFVRVDDAIRKRPALAGFMKTEDGDIEDEDAGSINVSVSHDGRFAFVSEENNATITVLDLQKAQSLNYSRKAIVGEIEVGNAPITTAFSNDGRTMYATSEAARRAYAFPNTCKEEGAPADAKPERPAGVIFSIDVATAESNPAAAVKGKVAAECSPVRLSMAPDGASAWVSNRGSNTASLFDLAHVDASDNAALVTSVAVGSNPVAITVTRDGRYVLVGNTNRFGTGGTNAGSISVIDTRGRRVVGTIPAGLFPRQFSPGVGTTLFLSNNRSDTVTVIDESRLKF